MLQREAFLGGVRRRFGSSELIEVTGLELVSVSFAENRRDELGQALQESEGLNLPAPGQSTVSSDGRVKLFWMAPDQLLAVASENRSNGGGFAAGARSLSVEVMRSLSRNAGFYTDQSDNWCALRLSGIEVIPALERICPLDLHDSRFPVGSVGRTVIEHLHTVIHRENGQQYLLLSTSSSAQSFLHAIETSLRNVTL